MVRFIMRSFICGTHLGIVERDADVLDFLGGGEVVAQALKTEATMYLIAFVGCRVNSPQIPRSDPA